MKKKPHDIVHRSEDTGDKGKSAKNDKEKYQWL